ncbi:hypothetical protein ACSLO9_33000, partial [Escherichia coli]
MHVVWLSQPVRTKARELGISMILRGDFHPSAKYSQRDIELARQL